MNFVTHNDSLYVVADLRLKQEFAVLVTKDAKATIKSLGVLGDKYVDIKTGKGAPVADGDFITLTTEDGLANITSKASLTFEKINTMLDKLNNGKGMVGRLISDEKMGTELAETISSLKATTAELSSLSKKASHGNGLLPKLLNDKAMAKKYRRDHRTSQPGGIKNRTADHQAQQRQRHPWPALFKSSTLQQPFQNLDIPRFSACRP